MPRAYLRFPPFHVERCKSFAAGLSEAGFDVTDREFAPVARDALVLWNRMPRDESVAARYQKVGAKIIIAENGYIGSSPDNSKLIALSRTYHNGGGQWPEGDASRWDRFNVPLKPWREDGQYVLALPSRGFGSPGVAMPAGWANQIKTRLQRLTKRPIMIRRHPAGTSAPHEPTFENVWAAVTWGSGAGIKALAAGIPVFHDFPHWIGKEAAIPLTDADFEKPFLGDRLPMFRRLAWAQWSVKEIETGLPIRELCAL